MTPTGIRAGSGELESFLRPGGAEDAPSRPVARPVSPYGQHGAIVEMRPVPGLTPHGVFKGNKPLVFQIPPIESFGEDGAFKYADYGTVSAGDHSVALGPGLRTVTYDTMFVDWQPVWAVLRKAGWHPNPLKLVQEICAIRDRGKPFHLLAHQKGSGGYDVNYAATLRSVHWEFRAGEVDAYYVTVSFTEYSAPNIKKFLAAGSGSAKTPVTLPIASLGAARNTLSKLAKFYYGDPSAWRVIAASNGITSVSANTVLTVKNAHRTKITVPRLADIGYSPSGKN